MCQYVRIIDLNILKHMKHLLHTVYGSQMLMLFGREQLHEYKRLT